MGQRQITARDRGTIWHSMGKGNRNEVIFRRDEDRQVFLSLLAGAELHFNVGVHVYALMDDHYHLLLTGRGADVARFIHWLKYNHVQRMNRIYGRKGHLFHPRNHTLGVRSESLVLYVSAYVHLNPVVANRCQHPSEAEWTSFRYYSGKAPAPPWLDCSLVLEHLEQWRPSAGSYGAYVEAVMDRQAGLDLPEGADPESPELARDMTRIWRGIDLFLSRTLPMSEQRSRLRNRATYYALTLLRGWDYAGAAAALGWTDKYAVYNAKRRVHETGRMIQRVPGLAEFIQGLTRQTGLRTLPVA